MALIRIRTSYCTYCQHIDQVPGVTAHS